MSKIFTRTFRVGWSEVSASGQVGSAAYLRYLVETACDWGIAGGLGEAGTANPLGLLWLIRETEINFMQPLVYNEVFDFTIWMVSWQRVRGVRAFEITRQRDGAVILQGTQQIVSLDATTLRPMNLPQQFIDYYQLEAPRQFPSTRFPKLAPTSVQATQRVVQWADLDLMEHVNNAIYLDYVEEAAAQDFSTRGWSPAVLKAQNLMVATRRFHIVYQTPAVWGETLNVVTHPLSLHETGGSRCVRISRAADGAAVADCIVDWSLFDGETGAPRPVPADLTASLQQDIPID